MYVRMLNKTNITHLQLMFPSLTVQPTQEMQTATSFGNLGSCNSKNYDTSKINLYHHVQTVVIDMKI